MIEAFDALIPATKANMLQTMFFWRVPSIYLAVNIQVVQDFMNNTLHSVTSTSCNNRQGKGESDLNNAHVARIYIHRWEGRVLLDTNARYKG